MKRVLPLVIASGSLSACLHSASVDPPPPVTLPNTYGSQSDAALPERWWHDFNDRDLDALVERAVNDSFQMKTAWARLKQADAISRQATSPLFPGLALTANGGRQRLNGVVTGPGSVGAAEVDSFSLSVGAQYELDIWGKVRSQRAAANFDLDASRDDVEAMAMTLAAQTAETWFNLVAQRATEQLLNEQLATNQTFLELVTLRFEQGLNSALDVHQQTQQVASTRAQLATVRAQVQVLEHQLAVLVGQPPNEVVAGERVDLPELPALPGTGLPSELLTRRPDVRAARRRVESADARIGVALADMFPSLRITASIGFSATKLADLFDEIVWSILGSLTQPLFEGGRRVAELDRTKAALEERMSGFGQVFLQALLEVENALVREKQQIEHLAQLHAQAKASDNALREARNRYTQGLSDFLPVLTALATKHRVDQSVVNGQRQLLSYRIQLCRALGGTWTSALTMPSDEDDANSEVSAAAAESDAS